MSDESPKTPPLGDGDPPREVQQVPDWLEDAVLIAIACMAYPLLYLPSRWTLHHDLSGWSIR
jgi:hypothetical protein